MVLHGRRARWWPRECAFCPDQANASRQHGVQALLASCAMRAAALQVLAQVCSFSAVAGFSVVGFTEVDPFDGRVRRSAIQTHRPLAPTAGVCLSCPTISPSWVRRGATLGQRLGTTRLQMKLPDFGLNAREIARLSQMKRRDEPLEEEVRGLYVLGAAGGLVLGVTIVRSVLLGLIIGVQLAPLLAFMEGAQGERVRLAGWETWRLCQIQVRRSEKAWGVVQREVRASPSPHASPRGRRALCSYPYPPPPALSTPHPPSSPPTRPSPSLIFTPTLAGRDTWCLTCVAAGVGARAWVERADGREPP